MRRISIWITATLAVAGLLFAFQLNASGTTGKSGDDGNRAEPGVTAPASPGAASPGADETKPGDDTPGDGEHVGKPGENK